MFNGTGVRNQTQLEGITFGDTKEEINASICAISDYLKQLKTIVGNLTDQPKEILPHTDKFLRQFDYCVNHPKISKIGIPKQCHRNVTTSDHYTMKEIGFQIINSTKSWVESFTGTKHPCLRH